VEAMIQQHSSFFGVVQQWHIAIRAAQLHINM
jgi:hypothetical protein